jgi:hypothetical protein
VDHLNTVADVCTDPTMQTFLDYFDPLAYAPTQHGPLLTIVGTADQYFTLPAINTTYDRVTPAGSSRRFRKRIVMAANGKHGVVDSDDPLATFFGLLPTIVRWLDYSFADGVAPPETPSIERTVSDGWMMFRVSAPPGGAPIRRVDLEVATQLDSTPAVACDFSSIRLLRSGDDYFGWIPIGTPLVCGPPVSADNLLYYANAADWAGYTVSSRMYYRSDEMRFGSGFVPRIEHWRGDRFPVPPAPQACEAQR